MNRLAIISGIIDSLKSINSITDAQVKDLIAKVVSYTVNLSELTIDPDPNNCVVYSPDEATVVGLFVKQHKGFVMLTDAHYSGRLDSCWPIIRINYEAYIKMKYLIQEGKSAQREYRLLSFKNRYDIYKGYNTEDNPVHRAARNRALRTSCPYQNRRPHGGVSKARCVFNRSLF